VTLTELAQAFLDRREGAGTFVDLDQATRCAIDAARFYHGWVDIISAPDALPAHIDAATDLTADEWTIITPLFELLCDREAALMNEASRVMGVEYTGRSSSEIASDLVLARETLARQAYIEPVFSVGL
jgi:hypothetical protein